MSQIILAPIDTISTDKAAEEAKGILIKNQDLIIRTQSEYNYAENTLQLIKSKMKGLDISKKTITIPLDLARKSVMDLFRIPLGYYEETEKIIKSKMLAYYQEQERLRREAEAKLQAKAEKERQEALAKAEAARANGKETRAEKYEEKAASIIAPQLAPSIDKGGAIIKKLWSAEVYDLRALVTAIAAEKAPLSLIEPNMTAIHAQARAFKDTLNLPGVRAVCEDNLSIRS